ncbi:MAG: polysaccharide pyruvyl transferase family protein [Cyclobacteriaceae bacterium]|nr:polysaccharide pyruvyl transferase family protein [Cyclobacteriaceae bacterium]
MNSRKKVLIVPSNTDLNRGDQSLTWETANIVKSLFGEKGVKIYLYKNRNSVNVNGQTEKLEYNFVSRILAHPNRFNKPSSFVVSKLIFFKWGFVAFFDLVQTLFLISRFTVLNNLAIATLNKSQKQSFEVFQKIDYLFVKGGGFLHSYGGIADPYIMYFQLFDVFLAHKLGKKIIILPNSIGPFKNKLAGWIVTKALSKCALVSVREGVSGQFMKTQNIPHLISPDLGFYLRPSQKDYTNYLLGHGVPVKTSKNIAITLRPYRFDGKENAGRLYTAYLNKMEEVVERLLKLGYAVTLLSHTYGPSLHEDDRVALRPIYMHLSEKYKNLTYLHDKNLNCTQLEKIYSYYDVVIGTRFHSVIFALNVDTPAIAIAYGGNKAYGIMQDMELEEYVVPIENPDSEVILNLVNQILIMPKKYLKKVFLYKQLLIEEREKLVELIKSSVEP